MKTKLLTLFSLLVLLLVSTSILADGRPTGIRIGRATGSFGGTTPMVEIDVTVPGTDSYYPGFSTTVWLGNRLESRGPSSFDAWQYASSASSVPLPWAIDWGDGSQSGRAQLFGPPGGPFTGTFAHTYLIPGTYIVTVGDALCCSEGRLKPPKPAKGNGPTVTTGNAITYSTRYIETTFTDDTYTWYYPSAIIVAVTANTMVRTGFGIPTTNTYGLIALALLLVGSGLLLFRKPTVA